MKWEVFQRSCQRWGDNSSEYLSAGGDLPPHLGEGQMAGFLYQRLKIRASLQGKQDMHVAESNCNQ